MPIEVWFCFVFLLLYISLELKFLFSGLSLWLPASMLGYLKKFHQEQSWIGTNPLQLRAYDMLIQPINVKRHWISKIQTPVFFHILWLSKELFWLPNRGREARGIYEAVFWMCLWVASREDGHACHWMSVGDGLAPEEKWEQFLACHESSYVGMYSATNPFGYHLQILTPGASL